MERASGMSCVERLPVVREEKAGFVWWKLPMEFLKLLAFKIRPTWSISMVAALMGAFMLGRRLYRKKPKSRRIPLKVSVGDKVSPFTVPVARLNEAFSVVKRVPVIRASLPAAGVAPWPALALR
ncbi:unnamed protein product [Spirodela intermedia]|uniref:Uncharacterized protein n=1 Tax=Spirodela intermedia TaxID=51605 RepID=A0A7I8ITC7_SPIIN|nr:unnamed protein product [Spirodela intermedia]CAA6660204.1 unnamed protein product [Spirodela intermedia]